jgi:queuine tRNA-ribosyltransferase
VFFKVISTDSGSSARRGELKTKRGKVNTPAFMPVATRGTIRAMGFRELEEIGFEMILSNTYHMYIRPGEEILAAAGGLNSFMNFHRPLLTDSGGFQVFSLADLCKIFDHGVEFRSHLDGSKHLFTPEKVLDIQRVIGSDIMMVLDQCIEFPVSEEKAGEALERTVNWAKDSVSYWKKTFDTDRQKLFSIVQGSVYNDLRKECAERLVELDCPGYAVGGLSVGEPKGLYQEITEYTLQYLPEDKPRYMMGVGSPMEILFAVKQGVDMFDCVMPTRIARNGTLFTSSGRINIKGAQYEKDFSPLDESCDCFVCKTYTRAYLRHIYRMGEISALIYTTYHNLFFMKKFMNEIQESIEKGEFLNTYKKWESIY